MTTSKTYWGGSGKYRELAEKLYKLIPTSGSVANVQERPCLEKFRLATNCYYDLFNNGLCNRAKEFRQVFGFAGVWIAKRGFPDYEPLEARMDEIILAASMEQAFEEAQ